MSDWETVGNDYLADLARRPAARAPASIGEILSSEWNRNGLDTLTGVGKPMSDAYDELVKGVEGAAGRPIGELAPGLVDAVSTEERARMIRGAIADLPEEKRAALEPLFDVRRRASEIAHKTEADANDVYSATYGLSGVASSWLAGIARQAVDPVNLATLPAGGPLKGPVLKMLLREAGVGALSQAVQEPGIEAGRGELGLDAGFGRGAGNVAQAALGAGGIAGLLRAGSAGIRLARGASEAPGARPADRAAPDSGGVQINAPADSAARNVLPEDLTAAAHLAERDQMLDRAVPPTFDAAAHAEGIAAAGRAIEEGKSIDAYHGSPHDFERFDMSKIGTGEGAQAYGHGLYFAENRGVAQNYETADAGTSLQYDGRGILSIPMAEFDALPATTRRALLELRHESSLADAKFNASNLHDAPLRDEILRLIKDGHVSERATGNLYKVNIAADKERFLDWDKPLSAQTPQVQAAVKQAMGIDYHGKFDAAKSERIWNEFKNSDTATAIKNGFIAFDDKTVASRLRAAGVPGIKYLDQGSRNAAQALAKSSHPEDLVAPAMAHNFVLFDDSLARITHKNDVPVPRVEDLPFPASEKASPPTPGPSPQGGGEPTALKPLGDPVIAKEFERVIAETGDMEIHIGDQKMKVSEAMKLAESDAAAARELTDCIGAAT